MSWEDSKAVTPRKRNFLKAFFAREKRLFLTGGSALGLFYLEHRCSYELDLSSQDRVDWLELDGVMRLCAGDIGADLDLLRDAPAFRRCRLARANLREIVDLYFLEKDGFRVERYFEDAQRKDGGLDPAMVSLLLHRPFRRFGPGRSPGSRQAVANM